MKSRGLPRLFVFMLRYGLFSIPRDIAFPITQLLGICRTLKDSKKISIESDDIYNWLNAFFTSYYDK